MDAKRMAAEKAVDYVEEGFVIGVGSGSTVLLIIEVLAERMKDVKIVPASWQSHHESVKAGLSVVSLDQAPRPDLYLDSFDQVTPQGYMVKGAGGAMLREKILASASSRRIFVGEFHKLVEKLNRPVPVEVIPFGYPYVKDELKRLGAKVLLRSSAAKNGPTISDDGNFIIDADFGEIMEPAVLEKKMKSIPGVVESGLFVGLADTIIIVAQNGKTIIYSFR